jgi:hypothetical protein
LGQKADDKGQGLSKNAQIFKGGDSVERLRTILGAALLTVTVGLYLGQVAHAAAPPQQPLWKACLVPAGAEATSQCQFSQVNKLGLQAVATDPTSGHVYVVDGSSLRVDEFTAWGEFRLAWGWGVANGASELQQCGPAATPPSSCQAAIGGTGPGQIPSKSLNSLAVDSSGAIYLYSAAGCTGGTDCQEQANRVQKFNAAGELILVFGREVNLTKVALRESQEQNAEPVTVTPQEENLCTVASGNQCGRGNLGAGNGQFGTGPLTNDTDPPGQELAIGPGDKVYVGGQERVQVFSAAGTFLESIPVPGEAVLSVTVLSDGSLVLIPAGLAFEGPGTAVEHRDPAGALICTAAVPEALGVTSAQNDIFVLAGDEGEAIQVRKFNSGCAEDATFVFSSPDGSSGFAANIVTQDGQPGIYVTGNDNHDALEAFSPPPDRPLPFDQVPQVPPSIESQFTSMVGSESAELAAQINPHFFADTSYYVEYGPEPCEVTTCTKAPLGPVLLGAGRIGNAVRTAPITLGGLQPGTDYFFRFVSESSGGGPVRGTGGAIGIDGVEGQFSTFAPTPTGPVCPNAAFRGGPSAHLSKCRAYELVSPIDKNGGDVAANAAVINFGTLAEAADSGDRATFSSVTAFADPSSAPLVSQFLSERTDSGWKTQAISAPRGPEGLGISGRGRYKGFTPDLCSGWFLQDSYLTLTSDAPVGYPEAYRRTNCSDPFGYQALAAAVPLGFAPNVFQDPTYADYVEPLGGSTDGQFSVFRAPAPLTADACKNAGIVQTYERGPEGLRLISVLPNGKGSCSHSSAGTFYGSFDQINLASIYHAVSNDGSTVYWSENGNTTSVIAGAGPEETGGVGRLLVRLHAQSEGGKCSEPGKACTQVVAESSRAAFVAASPDGSHAIYTIAAEQPPQLPIKLFMYDANTNASSLLAEIPAAEVGPNGYLGVIGGSQDLSRIYFVATANLTGGQTNSGGDSAAVGRPNIYLSENGALTFIATLGRVEGRVNKPSPREGGLPASPLPIFRSSRVSSDGSTLVFTSSVQLTNRATTDRNSGEPDSEVYMYRVGSGTGTLTCPSCNPSGARPLGRQIALIENEKQPLWAASTLPGWAEANRPSRLLSDDGSYLFFQSFDQLTPGDHNLAQDVYEWQRAASRSECEAAGAEVFSASAGGCLTLISSGTSPLDSELIDASATGSDVFFMTGADLVPRDEGQFDMYDARVGGGFPEAARPQPCQGEGCQAAPPPPGAPALGSGAKRTGNPKPKCPKGKKQVKAKHGKSKCVKRRPKSSKAQKHGKRGSKPGSGKKSGGKK